MPFSVNGQAPSPDVNSPEYIFSQIQDFSSILRDISMNVPPAGHPAPTKHSLPHPDQSHNSSLGLLPLDAVSGMASFAMGDTSTMENCPPTNISLGRYLQPAHTSLESQSAPLSDSDDDNSNPTYSLNIAPHPPYSVQESSLPQPFLDTPPHLFAVPFPVPTNNTRQLHTSSTPLQPPLKRGSQLQKFLASAQTSGLANFSSNSLAEFNASGGFPWDKIVKGETSQDISSLQKQLSPDLSTLSDSWHQDPQDPSFCSGKFSARSTSFGGENNTRDENFSDFIQVSSFQSQGSFASHHTTNNMQDSMFHTGFPAQQTTSDVFQGFDLAAQAELGDQFGDQEFGSLGKEQLKCFLDQEEAECLQANPFIEEEPCAEPADSSVFSGVSDKSIVLRNSKLWGGDTSQVDLGQLRLENQLLTKVSRCEYFRHNSSRLGSLEETVPDCDRPGLGFVHHIRSPERKPCALLSETQSVPLDSLPTPVSSNFSMEQGETKDSQGRASDGPGSSNSAPSSANTTYMPSGNSTKTVVSMLDQSGTLKAAELASRLQTLVDQLGSDQTQSVSYPDVVEDSIASNQVVDSQLESSIQESFGHGADINLSTISKVLSEASVSCDPQHFVGVILGCLKKRVESEVEKGRKHTSEVFGEVFSDEVLDECDIDKDSIAEIKEKTSHSQKEDHIDDCKSFNTPASSVSLARVNNICTTPIPSYATLSYTPSSSKMTPTLPERALTPSSAEPLSRLKSGVGTGHSKPIKPFNTVNSVPYSHVVPVKPQPSIQETSGPTSSNPSSGSSTPTLPCSKTSSLPSCLNTSNRTRRPSGARHSSPIKKVVTIKSPPTNNFSTPTTNDLSKLLDSAQTPSLHLASSSQLTTSTPFHPGLNLSTVILDHLTHNQSVSPLVNPDTSISRVNLDISTISPALFTSIVKPTHCTPSSQQEAILPPQATLELPPDWSHSLVTSSHTRVMVPVPVKHNLTNTTRLVMKVTSMWVGSCLVPPQHWEQLVDTKWETVVTLEQEENVIIMDFLMKKGGAFTFNIGVVLDNGVSSSGLLRIQVEEPNIQVLTDNGSKIDFSILPEDCSRSLPLVLVNCGVCSVPLHLQIRYPNDLFSFADGSKETSFNIPGITGEQAEGQGVAKDIDLIVNTGGVTVTQPRVFQTELLVLLGDKESGTLLGSVDITVKVGTAKLRTKKSAEPILFTCLPGETVTQSVQLRNCGNIPLQLRTVVEDDIQGHFYYDKNIRILPDSDFLFPVTFTCSPQASITTSQHTLYLSVSPNGPKHLITLQTSVLSSQEHSQEFRTSRPVLSFGILKKPDTVGISQDLIPSVFPVESDRSVVNFFSVPVGSNEVQSIILRNSTSDTVCLNMIIRDTESFSLLDPAGAVSTSQLVLMPQSTQNVRVVYRPTKVGTDCGKLVLKPQGRKVGGKSFKASINLCGVAGSCDIEMAGLEEVETHRYQLVCQQFPAKQLVRFRNKGETTGFVKITSDGGAGETKLDITPSVFLLGAGSTKDVSISYLGEDEFVPFVTIFTGPELVRQVLKRARLLTGALRMNDNPSFLGIDFTQAFPGEELSKTGEEFIGQLTASDANHFYQKTIKCSVSLRLPHRPAEFDQLLVEDTLSETRIDQSIALPPPPTHQTRSVGPSTKPANFPFQHSRFPEFKSSTSQPRMPNSAPTTDSHIKLIPSQLSLPSGGEAMFKLLNQSPQPVHWDLSWPSSKLSISPGAGLLSPHGQAVVCVQAVQGQPSWRGQVSVYSDNSVDSMEVVVTAVAPSTCISVSTNQVELGAAVLGSTTTGSIVLTNPGMELVQWKAKVDPSFFSLPQCAGLLNPTQSITIPILFRPAAPGTHTASLSFSTAAVRGGTDMATGPPVLVTMRGTAVSITDAVSALPNPPAQKTKQQTKKNSGTVSLESDVVKFPDTMLGETTVSKVKIKNRSGFDQAVEILPLPAGSPFKTVHSVLEVKNQCYCTVPVQFRPLARGEYNTMVTFKLEGNMIRATLRGKAV